MDAMAEELANLRADNANLKMAMEEKVAVAGTSVASSRSQRTSFPLLLISVPWSSWWTSPSRIMPVLRWL